MTERSATDKIRSIPTPGRFGKSCVKWCGWTDEQYKFYLMGFNDCKEKCIEATHQHRGESDE